MKLHLFPGHFWALLVVLGWAVSPSARAQTTNLVNDGTSTVNLTLRQNLHGRGTPAAGLLLSAGGDELLAAQSPDYSDFPINGVWFDNNLAPATNAYALLADARPIQGFPEYVVGIMAWFDPDTGKGIAFRVVPGTVGSFQAATIDFQALSREENDSVTNLFTLQGAPAEPFFGSAWADVGTYDPAANATLRLEFTPPTPAEIAAVTNGTVTAHLTARVFQAAPGGGEPAPIGGQLELLTTLPVPSTHRFGYFASWGAVVVPGDSIGYFDNLRVIGDLRRENFAPTVAITSPTNGSQIVQPASVRVDVEAVDPEGRLARVDLFNDDQLVASTNRAPAVFELSGLAVGSHTLRAEAVDEAGAMTPSTTVTIQVLPPAEPPRLTDPTPLPTKQDFQQLKFTAVGLTTGFYRIEATTNFTAWSEVQSGPITGANMDFTLPRIADGARVFYRLAVLNSGGVSPARIVSPAPSPSAADFQQFTFTGEAMTGTKYEIESSADLKTWTKIEEGAVSGPSRSFSIPRVVGATSVFYRIVSRP
jgi:hypothetical protein